MGGRKLGRLRRGGGNTLGEPDRGTRQVPEIEEEGSREDVPLMTGRGVRKSREGESRKNATKMNFTAAKIGGAGKGNRCRENEKDGGQGARRGKGHTRVGGEVGKQNCYLSRRD